MISAKEQNNCANHVHLEQGLAPFAQYLNDNSVTEICVNEQGGFWVERMGEVVMQYIPCPNITNNKLARLARLVATNSGQSINDKTPLLSSSLPSGQRIQFVLPPAAANGVALSIRKQGVTNLSLEDYAGLGAFDNVSFTNSAHSPTPDTMLHDIAAPPNAQNNLGGAAQQFIARAAQLKKKGLS